MAHEPSFIDLGEAEKSMCMPTPIFANRPDTMSNTTTLVDLGYDEKDYYSATANAQTVDEIVLRMYKSATLPGCTSNMIAH